MVKAVKAVKGCDLWRASKTSAARIKLDLRRLDMSGLVPEKNTAHLKQDVTGRHCKDRCSEKAISTVSDCRMSLYTCYTCDMCFSASVPLPQNGGPGAQTTWLDWSGLLFGLGASKGVWSSAPTWQCLQQFTEDPETHLASCYDISTSAVWVASAYFKLWSRDWNLPCPVQTAKLSNYVTLYTVPKSKWNCAERLNHATEKAWSGRKSKKQRQRCSELTMQPPANANWRA